MAFTGRPFDKDVGLQSNLNRWYDPKLGRWASEDPIGFAAGDPEISRYVGNSPTNFVDPTGEAANSGIGPQSPKLQPYPVQGVFEQNRFLGDSSATWNANPLSHGFLYTTNLDGTLLHTYSWGNGSNDPNGSHWFEDHPNDVSAAQTAILHGGGDQVGGSDLIPYVDKAFNGLNVPGSPSSHGNGWIDNNCKTEKQRLMNNAIRDRNRMQNSQGH